MGEVLASLGHETRELLAVLIGENDGVTGARLKELFDRESRTRVSGSTFWFHLNHLRRSGVVKARKRASPSLDSKIEEGQRIESGNPIYLSLDREVVQREIERIGKEFGVWQERG